MPSQIQIKNSGKSRGALHRSKLPLLALFFILFSFVANAAGAAPVITSISPTTVVAGQQVTITGTNFGSTSAYVMFGSIAYPWVSSWTNTQIVVTVPSNAQSAPVYVQNSGGAQSNSVNLTVSSNPTITSISPTTAVAGQQVTITGTNFGGTSAYVVFGSIAYPWVSSWTNTQIVVTVPSNAQSAPVYVQNSSGAHSNLVNLTVVYPTITSISPTTVAPGQQVTITGTNFGSTSAYVMFGSIAYPWVSSWSNTQIVVTVPANAQSAPVHVQNSGGAQSNLVNLTVSSGGAVASLSPSSLTFASQAVGATSAAQTITLNNTGNAALSITSIAFTGADPTDFTEVNTCSPSVAAGGNCTIVILFTPSAAGTRGASLTITDNASGSPQSVSLAGTGTHDVILTWTPSTTPGIKGYNVYRGTTPGGESSTPLNTLPVSGTTFADVNVQAGLTYYYVVTAASSNGTTQSSDSNEASATVPSP